VEFFFIASLLVFVGILLYNTFKMSGGLLQVVKFALDQGTTERYWPDVWSMLSRQAIYSSVLMVLVAFCIYCFIWPYVHLVGRGSSNVFRNRPTSAWPVTDVEKAIALLKNRLPAKPTAVNYQLTTKMLGKDIPVNLSMVNKLQRLADAMCRHLLLPKSIPVRLAMTSGAGQYSNVNGREEITLNAAVVGDNAEQLAAVLAHEVAHYYLHHHGIRLKDTAQNEFLTEMAAVYLGFGFLLQQGYAYLKKGDSIHKVGYINKVKVFDAIVETTLVRRQSPFHVIDNLSLSDKAKARYRLDGLVREYKAQRTKAST